MAVKTKKQKIAEARKNAEALKAKKKAVRDAKAKLNTNMTGPAKKGAKPASIIKQAAKKKR